MYLTYEEYVEMGGSLSEAAFNDIEYEARAYIDWITFRRIRKMLARGAEIPHEVQECIYHISRLIEAKMSALNVPAGDTSGSYYGAGIASQSNDGVSISFNVLSAKDVLDNSEKEINKLITRYLDGICDDLNRKLTYRGLYPDE